MENESSFLEEIGGLVEILFRQWRLIAAATLACALAAGLLSFLMPKSYQADALIASTRIGSDVSLGSTIETTSDDQLVAARIIDQRTRLQSYLQLVESPIVAQSVLEEVAPQFPKEELTVPDLLKMVEGEISEGSDSIKLTATSGDPNLSAAIANAWAQAYVDQVNSIYSEQSVIEGYSAIQSQLEKNKTEYESAQAALEVFVSNSQINDLERQIIEKQEYINALSLSRTSVLTEMVSNMENSLVKAYNERRKVGAFLAKAQDMRAQVAAGGEGAAASNALALNLLKTEVFATDTNILTMDERIVQPGTNLMLQTDLITMTSEAMLADLEALIGALEARTAGLDESIVDLSTQMLALESNTASTGAVFKMLVAENENDQKLGELGSELSQLQAQLERESARRTELTQERNLAWESYKNLQIKAAELNVALGIKNAALVLAAPAIPPRNDTSSGLMNVIIASGVGFVFGVLAAFAIEFWWRYKGLAPYPLLGRSARRQESVSAAS